MKQAIDTSGILNNHTNNVANIDTSQQVTSNGTSEISSGTISPGESGAITAGGGAPGAVEINIGGASEPKLFMYENQEQLNGKEIDYTYYSFDSTGNVLNIYGSYDDSPELANFKSLGLSICLLIFSIYLFHVSTKLYRQYFDKKSKENYFTQIFYMSVILLNIIWVSIILAVKNIPFQFITYELIYYPNQFVLGIMLSSLLLFSVGLFRFSLIAFIPNSNDDEKTLKDSRFSFVGIIFGLLSALANLVTIWVAFK